ncbi:HrpF/NolX family T3SS translocon protein [Mesorhizobium humile]|uniref:HrpF/NolX family T3SS translocon protein n=1 Tax=Mesorhizobium humile TaxID=3072313 RepID=A0ABU4YQ29_9HYPH|nr:MULTISPECIES: HrpF/NolX family T3SS translocon protein [unclassified Mesorhizobium]MDX8461288.1 HrpF/NolX family T3SS translocon protein [Mesorhizobium sp. VK2D]MDX8488898.1 HrpF/NolX family T3SS translocon protein [Mesorhizobium sp. VK2B]
MSLNLLTANSSTPAPSPQAWSGPEPSPQIVAQTGQGAFLPFQAMLSSCSPQENAPDSFAQLGLPPANLKSAMDELQQHPLDELSPDVKSSLQALRQHPLELMPPALREALKSMDQALPAVASPPIAPPPIAPAPIAGTRITWCGGKLTEPELQIVAVLNRHKDKCPLSWDSLSELANDPSTPPDLKAAIESLQQDPELFYAIGSQGDGRCGGKIKAKDLSGFSDLHPQVAAFQDQQARSYEQNYIPSDGSGNGQPTVMTLNDAVRELYRYSDNLPENLSLADFRQIVDGTAKTGKCPPQVTAAAQYFLTHPDSWKQLYGGSIDKVHKYDFLQVASSSMSLTQPELNTLDMINRNQQAFFGSGVLTRDKLAKMADDKSLSPKVRQAASQLLSDPLLFGLLNNSITGYKTHHRFFDFGGGHTVDSGNISNRDFAKFYNDMTVANRTVQQAKAHVPKTAADQDAVADMKMGVADQPDTKSAKKNGGAFMHTIDGVLKVGSKVFDWAATAVGLLSFVPGLGQIADAVSMALEGASQAGKLIHTAISGGNIKKALAEAGLDLAAQAVGLVAGPEVKLAIRNGLAKAALEEAFTAGVNLPVEAAKSYAENYLADLKASLEAGPMQAAGVPDFVGMATLAQRVA